MSSSSLDKIVHPCDDHIGILIYEIVHGMQIIIKYFYENKTLMVKTVDYDDSLYQYALINEEDKDYIMSIINMVNDIITSFNNADTYQQKVYYINQLYGLIYAKEE